MEHKTDLEQGVAELLVNTLKLDTAASQIDPLAPLFGDIGLGLDSIDMLELALAISKQYTGISEIGTVWRSDAGNNLSCCGIDHVPKCIDGDDRRHNQPVGHNQSGAPEATLPRR